MVSRHYIRENGFANSPRYGMADMGAASIASEERRIADMNSVGQASVVSGTSAK